MSVRRKAREGGSSDWMRDFDHGSTKIIAMVLRAIT